MIRRKRVLTMVLVALGVAWGGLAQAALPFIGNQETPTLAPMLNKVTPAVVNIATVYHVQMRSNPLLEDPLLRRFFGLPRSGQPKSREAQSAGSGVIVHAGRGLILTNHHVVEKAEEIHITLKDGRKLPAKLVGSDEATDIAVLQVKPDQLTEIPIGNSDLMQVGDFVVAIGNPFGLGQTVTSGIVSAMGRSGLGIEGYEDFIQTDASINPGNSGGALVNLRGELVGINAAILSKSGGNIGIGFAVPVNMAKSVMDQLIQYGEVRRGRLGIATQDLTPELAKALGVERPGGAVIAEVEPGSAAEKVGLKAGDVVVEVNGHEIRSSMDLRNKVGLIRVGEDVAITFARDNRLQSVSTRLAEAQVSRKGAEQETGHAAQLAGALFKPGKKGGVQVAQVEEGSPSWDIGLRKGDVVLSVNREKVDTVDALLAMARAINGPMALGIKRGEMQVYIMVK